MSPSPAPSVLLIGPRRMAKLADALKAVAPHARFTVAATAAEGEGHLAGADAVILADRATRAYVQAPRLAWLHLYPTGIDHVVIPELRDARFTMTHKVWASVGPMAEHAFALILAIARRLPEYAEFQRKREWRHHSTWPTTSLLRLAGHTLAVIGYGNVGQAIGKRAKVFDMKVIGVRRDAGPAPHADVVVPRARLAEALAAADFVVLATSLNDDTWHLMGAGEFAAMRPSAWFVNISRGPVVDEQAMLAALKSRAIAGAALDVFDEEPLPATSEFWTLPNVIVTPHAAGSGPDNEADATAEIVANFRRFLAGEPLEGRVKAEDIPVRAPALAH